jgi:hypothetical protein
MHQNASQNKTDLKNYLKLLCSFSFFIAAANLQTAWAQFYPIYPVQYRPPNQHWQQLTLPHFRIIFSAGQDSAAFRTAYILERQYPKIKKLTGGNLTNFPVILNGYSDLSNGFVTPFNFRSEIIISPAKGKSINPVNGGWLRNVVPHEMTHALQFSHFGGFGIGSLVHIFSPDLARSLHSAPPSGIQEGLAVFHESHGVAAGGGRGHYPFFTNVFNSVFHSCGHWSMGQMVQPPVYTRPFNRYYIGGYEFTNWLQKNYGPKTSRDAIDFHIRWPFLGYGIALKHATGRWPGQLYHQFVNDKEKELRKKYHNKNYSGYSALPIPYRGGSIRRPKWLSDSTLIFYGSFYNAKPGFYRYNLHTHLMKRALTTGSVDGYNYALSASRKSLIYSFYKPNLIYPNDYKTALIRTSLSNGKSQYLNIEPRLYDPVFISDSALFALKVFHTSSKLVEISLKSHTIHTLFADPNHQIVSVTGDPPDHDSLAIIMNKNGNQALWIASVNNMKNDLAGSPAISFSKGSVFDPVWRSDGKCLLFSADFSGVLQVYEYHLQTGSIIQITNARFNAFEASYNPDGNRIAFIIQKGNEKLPVVLPRSKFYDKPITENIGAVLSGDLKVASAPKNSWKVKPYKTGMSWLKPRTVVPVIKKISGSDHRYRFGAGLYSSDLLAEQAYSVNGTIAKGRFWYDAAYRNRQFFPGFKIRIYSHPEFNTFQFRPSKGKAFIQNFLRQKRRFELSVPMQFTLKQNVSSTLFFVQPKVGFQQIRYFDDDGTNRSNFANTPIGGLFMQFDYRIQQDIRSVQLNSGLILYSELEQYFSSPTLHLHTLKGNASLQLGRTTALRAGFFEYISPLRQWNQSLRLGVEAIDQTGPDFDNQSIVSNGFSDQVFPLSGKLLSLSGRYTIPLFYPDTGGLLIPLYLSSIYLVAFSDTVIDPVANASRSVFGGGVRLQFRLSNLAFDIGFGIGYEPARNKTHFFIGSF